MVLRRDISKLGGENETDAHVAYLEQCRECIFMTGNALGLAHLIHSGKIYTTNQVRKNVSAYSSELD